MELESGDSVFVSGGDVLAVQCLENPPRCLAVPGPLAREGVEAVARAATLNAWGAALRARSPWRPRALSTLAGAVAMASL